jgi:acetylornithine deacetylase/succinyl-diaminopimelate desuccinylase-like protein
MRSAHLLADLIALPSVNPAFLPAGDPTTGEHLVADYLSHIARRSTLDIELQPVAPKRNNVIIRLSPTGLVRHRIVFAPHMDTVGVFDAIQFKPTRKRGRLYGRGPATPKAASP